MIEPINNNFPAINNEPFDILSSLPPEITLKVLSHLNPRDLESTSIANSELNRTVNYLQLHNKYFLIKQSVKKFMTAIPKKIKKSHHLMEQLSESINNGNIFSERHQIKPKYLRFCLIDKIAVILQSVKKKRLDKFEKSLQEDDFSFAEEIFSLTNDYKKILKFKNGTAIDDYPFMLDLKIISKKLARGGNIDRAVEIVEAIPSENIRNEALITIDKIKEKYLST